MAPGRRANCQICCETESKYICPKCRALYCSVACYRVHNNTSCSDQPAPASPPTSEIAQKPSQSLASGATDMLSNPSSHLTPSEPIPPQDGSSVLPPEPMRPLRKLSSLKWPYVPDTSSYPDPLTRDDPKPLTLKQYEAIATSAAVRRALASHERLPSLLRSLDQLRGADRDTALQRVLGVSPAQASGFRLTGLSASSPANYSKWKNGGRGREVGEVEIEADEEDMGALRALAEAVESAVRGTADQPDPLGLDWDSMAV